MKQQVFTRKVYERMLQWKKVSDGSTALLLQGARRVGKSTVAEVFAQQEYKSYVVIDFSEASPATKQLFDDMSNLDYFYMMLQSIYGVELFARQSVIILDEIQLYPPARQAIKHLVKDGRYDIIETGSLLSIRKNVAGILIPSEETRINMYPLDFEEFLWAIGKPKIFDIVRFSYEYRKPLGEAMHRDVMRLFRLYMAIGGMPQSVVAYVDTGNLERVDLMKRSIIDLYKEDFRKIDPLGRIGELFKSIPAELSRNTLRYKVGSVIENATASRLAEPLMEMAESMTVNFAFHSDDPMAGLALHANRNFFKLFMADTGLFMTLSFEDGEIADPDLYQKLLLDKLSVNLGYLYENVVAQLLRSAGHDLYYTTFRAGDKSYEIDFLIADRGKISPIEVKSSGYKVHKSIDIFADKYSSRIARKILVTTKDLHTDGDLLCIPVYMTGLL